MEKRSKREQQRLEKLKREYLEALQENAKRNGYEDETPMHLTTDDIPDSMVEDESG